MAKIKLNNNEYPIPDSVLAGPTADFIAHLGTIAGNGLKVVVGGVEYAISSDKVADAFEAFEDTLSDLQPEKLAPGLYRTGAIALYNAGDYEAASAMLETSWEQLEADGVIAISEGVKVPDDLVMNEYGFYFGVPYSMTMEGMTIKLTFNEDGSGILNQVGEIMEIPAGAVIYGDHSIDMTALELPIFTVSADGTVIEAEEFVFTLEILDLPEMNEYGFYFGVFYSTTMEGMTVGLTFNEDGSVIITSGGQISEIPAGAVIYGDHSIDMSALDMPVLAVSPDGTMIDLGGMILSVGSSNIPPKGAVYLPNRTLIEGDLVLPNDGSATSIPMGTFMEQTSLTDILISDSVTTIETAVFQECTSLISINLPSNITTIADNAFYRCTSLTSITIPNSVTSIGNSAFDSCSSLTGVYITDITKWCKIDFDGSSANPLNYAEKLYLNGNLVTELVIPDSVTSISSYAFYGCTSPTSAIIPDSVTTIGASAFAGCAGVFFCGATSQPDGWNAKWYGNRTPTILWGYIDFGVTENGLKWINMKDGITIFEYLGVENNIAIPDQINGTNVVTIFDCAFEGCSNLTSAVIPDGVTTIGSYAFDDCTSLTSIVIPDSVTSIGDYAFSGCESLEEIYFNAIAINNLGQNNWIFAHAGRSGSGIKVIIGKNVTKIPSNLFCPVTYVNYAPKIISVKFEEGSACASIGSGAFQDSSSLTSITIPDSVTSIGDEAFENCSSLTGVVIGDSVTSIGDYAFHGCSSLESATIGDSVTSIGDYAFWNCTRLTSIIIPDSVTSIGDYAFWNCTRLTSIIIPDSVTSIGDYAFHSCSSLESATIGDSVTSIGENAFQNCSSLESVTIPDSVTIISSNAFRKCTNLTSITIPDSVTNIDPYAIGDCSALAIINYSGTIAQWNAITKDQSWNLNVPATYVQCSDGQVAL